MRQARSGTVGPDCAERLAPARTILGQEQQTWLDAQLRESRATWDLLGQQVFMMEMDWVRGPARGWSNEGWDGYVASRDHLAATVGAHRRNAVVLTGDVHSHWASQISRDHRDPGSKPVAVELVTTSVTSAGDGLDEYPDTPDLLAENPHVRFFNGRRGYVRTRINAAGDEGRLPLTGLRDATGRSRPYLRLLRDRAGRPGTQPRLTSREPA